MDKHKFSILSANVRGLRDPTMAVKCQTLICNVLDSECDIACILDTHLDSSTEHKISNLWDGDSRFAHSGDHSAGIAFLTRNLEISYFFGSQDGRSACARISHSGHNLLVYSVYAPPKFPAERTRFFRSIRDHITSIIQPQDELVLLGDFNCVESPDLDRCPARQRADPSAFDLADLTSHFETFDSFRHLHPDTPEFTFYSANSGSVARLDRAYISDSLNGNLVNVEHPPNAYSDHTFLLASFDFNQAMRGKGTWKLDNNLLEDDTFITAISNFWSGWRNKKPTFPSVSEWWDRGKTHTKAIAQSHAKRLRRRGCKIERSLTKRLSNAINGGKTGLIAHLSAQIRTRQAERAFHHFSARNTKWSELGERCNSFFLNAHKKKVNQSTVHRINTPNGMVSDSEAILEEFTGFYRRLYSREPTSEDHQREIFSKVRGKLSAEQREKCAAEFVIRDLKHALNGSANGKAPGPDGLPVELYKVIWNVIGEDLFEVFQNSYSQQILPKSMRDASITVLPKTGDLTEVKNWRPISLLNADYKVFAKCIANRISTFLPFVVSPEQTASVRGRKISHNLSLVRDFIFLADTQSLDAFLISVDQHKAFDMVDWSFLSSLMSTMEFPDYIVNWVTIMYTNIRSRLVVNGFHGRFFHPTRGVRQGCPLSPALYVIFSEAVNLCISTNPDIQGPDILGKYPVISQFADDIVIGGTSTDSIFAIFRSLKIFELASGAKINPDKSNGLWLGRNRERTDCPNGVQFNGSVIKVLGLYLGSSFTPTGFWERLLGSVQRQIKFYTKLKFTLKGKIVVIKQLLIPLLVYPSFILVCPQHIIKRLQKMCDSFLWDYRIPKVPRDTIELPVSLGGLNYPCLESFFRAIRLSWTGDMFNSDTDGPWKIIAQNILSRYDRLPYLACDIFKVSLNSANINKSSLPGFYKTLLKDWIAISGAENRPRPITAPAIRSEPLFQNPFIIAPETGPLKPTKWYKDNPGKINKVSDLTYGAFPGFMPPAAVMEEQDISLNPNIILKLQNTIPKDWRETLSKPDPPDRDPPQFEIFAKKGEKPVKVSGLKSRDFYRIIKPADTTVAKQKQQLRKTPFYTNWEIDIGKVPWAKVFNSLFQNHSDRKSADLIYLLIHRGTFTRSKSWHISGDRSDALCLRCHQVVETPEHLFFECAQSVDTWEFALRFIQAQYPSYSPNFRKFVIAGWDGYDPSKNVAEDVRFALVAAIWHARNTVTFENTQINHLGYFRTCLASLLQLRANCYLKRGKEPTEGFSEIAEFVNHRVRFKL